MGIVIGVVLAVPRISDSKREAAQREREQVARDRAQRLRELRAERRPRLRAAAGQVTVGAVEAAITADAVTRARAGEFPHPARRTDCRRLTVREGRVLLGCTAVTSDIPPSESTPAGTLGYPYRAAMDRHGRRFAFCKISGQPGEGFLGRGHKVGLPAVCGG